jgi:hypothetical protein
VRKNDRMAIRHARIGRLARQEGGRERQAAA